MCVAYRIASSPSLVFFPLLLPLLGILADWCDYGSGLGSCSVVGGVGINFDKSIKKVFLPRLGFKIAWRRGRFRVWAREQVFPYFEQGKCQAFPNKNYKSGHENRFFLVLAIHDVSSQPLHKLRE